MAIRRGKKTTSPGRFGVPHSPSSTHPITPILALVRVAALQLIPPEELELEEDKHRESGENPSVVCACTKQPSGLLPSRLSLPGPIPLNYLQIKGLFSFPSAATARQTQ